MSAKGHSRLLQHTQRWSRLLPIAAVPGPAANERDGPRPDKQKLAGCAPPGAHWDRPVWGSAWRSSHSAGRGMGTRSTALARAWMRAGLAASVWACLGQLAAGDLKHLQVLVEIIAHI